MEFQAGEVREEEEEDLIENVHTSVNAARKCLRYQVT